MDEIPMIQGWAYIAWATENDAYFNGKREGKGYLAQEIAARAERKQNG